MSVRWSTVFDDFICSGGTIRRIVKTYTDMIEKAADSGWVKPTPGEYRGIFLFNYSEFRKPGHAGELAMIAGSKERKAHDAREAASERRFKAAQEEARQMLAAEATTIMIGTSVPNFTAVNW